MAAERILVVEDNADNLDLVVTALEWARYEVRGAVDADEALRAVAEFRPALILMDIQLPGMDGLELTRVLKRDEATRDIVIVAFTAYAMQSDERRALDAGCDAYVAKPVSIRALLDQLDRRLTAARVESNGAARRPRSS